ncbi:PDZ and LIM domain protein Zasp like protein [Argiope bruennichi]|uniref:PDZ and LIM domain protein Zasp like protein n=1 Tax=Argiope bruennichi TaxID=94029 RepID=A0A8T0E1M0_ARGBR|nr:PDZ and LIM domain protein Zasp like protein [Argiope bruennichi]
MAFQRPFLISLKRSDSSNRWGFGIKGGRDYDEPLRIQSVLDDSLAERSGLREGDEIIQVGKVNVQDLTLGQVHELLARCGNRIEMFVVREDLLSPRKGKEPPVTLAKQTEVLTEGQISAEEDEGPENLSFKEKSAVFKLLEEQSKEVGPPPPPRSTSSKQDTSNMTAIYRQQYEQHLQKQYEQQILMNNHIDDESNYELRVVKFSHLQEEDPDVKILKVQS